MSPTRLAFIILILMIILIILFNSIIIIIIIMITEPWSEQRGGVGERRGNRNDFIH